MKATTRPEPTVCSAKRGAAHAAAEHQRADDSARCAIGARSGQRRAARSASTPAAATPATRKREPIWKKGGKLTSANLMARYVEPQTIQVAARQATMSGEIGTRGEAREGERSHGGAS